MPWERFCTSKMVEARIKNDSWKEDSNLREKLKDYVTEGLRREEILDFRLRDFDCYAWSIRTLDRRLRYFDIRYTDTDVTVDEVEEAITREMGLNGVDREVKWWPVNPI